MDKRLLFSAILAAGIGATEAQAQKVDSIDSTDLDSSCVYEW